MGNSQQRCKVSVPAGLLDHTLAGIHQHDRKIRRARACNHVACVLHMARRIGHDEFAARCREVTVSDIDRNALLAFGTQAVGEIRQIDLPAASDVRGNLQRFDLILHQRLRII